MTPEPPQGEAKKKLPVPIIIVIVLAVAFGACSCIGVLAAIAIPNFLKFQGRSKQAECRTQLKGAYVAERGYYTEHNRYSENPEELGYAPEGKRSVMLFGHDAEPVGNGPEADALAGAIRSHATGTLGVSGTCPECEVVIGCAANVDSDEDADVWTVSTADRKSRSGKTISNGVPYNDYNDIIGAEGD